MGTAPFIRIPQNDDSSVTDYRTRKTLLLRIKDAGDGDAWSEFVELYTPLVFSKALLRVRGLADSPTTIT